MTIIVELEGHLYRIAGRKTFQINIKGGETIEDVISLLGIPLSEVGLVIINNVIAEKKRKVKDKDTIVLIPVLIGG